MKDEGEQLASPAVRVAPVAEEDIERVAQLAAEVWWHHYPGIISPAQIEYMLRERYAPALLRSELRRNDVWWDKLVAGDAIAAFASCFLVDAATLKLDKLYVHPAHQRRGYGGLLIAHACEHARERGCLEVVLAVNRGNASAIAAYTKHGFRLQESVVKDIGGGFVMDDYVMVRQP
jgi:GNAT superfamily N-acetyltransferase